eukprot:1977610-Heterocapsa_arctica.AAC.1
MTRFQILDQSGDGPANIVPPEDYLRPTYVLSLSAPSASKAILVAPILFDIMTPLLRPNTRPPLLTVSLAPNLGIVLNVLPGKRLVDVENRL